tara:strand:- start:340 stop:645 length:306 start_codon:yes stop_codon:yes gene_type:complete
MALTEIVEYDKIEVVGDDCFVQVRRKTSIKKNDEVIASSFYRYVLNAGSLDDDDNLIDNPLDKEPDGTTSIPDKVKNICGAVWTTDVKAAWKAKLIAKKSS